MNTSALKTFAPQVAALRKLAQADRTGLIDRVAYTWFNRLAALRFMDARGWHPFRARVLTPASAGPTPAAARAALDEAVRLFLRTADEHGTLADVLEEAGYALEGAQWRSPAWIGVERASAAINGWAWQQ